MRKDKKDLLDQILEAIDMGELALLMDDSKELLEQITRDGAAVALDQIGFNADESIVEQLNEGALQYAKDRSAEMVGKRWVDGELVDNPNAKWVITETTREMLRADLANGIERGLSNDDLAGELAANYAFSDERALTIARTETAFADVAGNLSAYRASGQVESKRWIVGEGCCDECEALDQVTVGLDEDFPDDGGDGPPLHPNCFSGDAVVAASGVTAYFKRRFKGEVVVIGAAGVAELTVTPNHAILTARGWIKAGELQLTDSILQAADPCAALSLIDPNHDYIESRFDQVSSARLMAAGVTTRAVPLTAEHFHGDGVADTEVDVISTACALRLNRSDTQKRITHCALCGREIGQLERRLAPLRGLDQGFDGAHTSTHGIMRRRDEALALFPVVSQSAAVATDSAGYINARLCGHVVPMKIERLGRTEFDGHVYNLETLAGWYFANGIIAHNCRCDLLPVLTDDAGGGE